MKRLIVAATVLFVTSQSQALAFRMSVAGLYNSFIPASNSNFISYSSAAITSSSASNGTGYGGGVLFFFPFKSKFGMEAGALYVPTNYGFTSSGVGVSLTGTVTSSYIQVPVLFRFTPSKYFSVGAGAYYAFGTGNISTTGTITTLGVTSNLNIPSVANNTGDYGALGSLALFAPIGKSTRLFLDARYALGVSNPSYAIGTLPSTSTVVTVNLKYTDFMALAGIQFGL